MIGSLNAWPWFTEVRYWWMHAMVALWLIFGLMLFIVEPLGVGPRIQRALTTEPVSALAHIEAVHWVLLVLSLVVIAVVEAGIYGMI